MFICEFVQSILSLSRNKKRRMQISEQLERVTKCYALNFLSSVDQVKIKCFAGLLLPQNENASQRAISNKQNCYY